MAYICVTITALSRMESSFLPLCLVFLFVVRYLLWNLDTNEALAVSRRRTQSLDGQTTKQGKKSVHGVRRQSSR